MATKRQPPSTPPTTQSTLPLALPDVLVTHLTIESFRGIKLLDLDLTDSPHGVIFAGTKGTGKTSAIRGIAADLRGAGISPDCIHADADKAQIVIDFSQAGVGMRARRTIRRNGTSTDLTNADGTTVPKAAAELRAIFGDRSLDPLELFSASAKDRRQQILDAVACQVTAEQLNRWCETTQEWNVAGNGFDVVARARQLHYERRTKANAVVEDLQARHRVASENVTRCQPSQQVDVDVETARANVAHRKAALAVVQDRRQQGEQRQQEAAATRTKIAELRARVAELAAGPDMWVPPAEEQEAALREVAEAKRALAAARERLTAAENACNAIDERLQAADRVTSEIGMLTDQANELEAIVQRHQDASPPATAEQEAQQALEAAQATLTTAEAWLPYWQAVDTQGKLEDELAQATAEAKKLDAIVKRLGAEAPAELAATANGIPGLLVLPDAIMFQVDPGKPAVNVDLLSDGERLEFAVEVSKRTAGAAKVLIVDKLESLPPSLIPGFVRRVIADGWVLFATWVRDGAMEVIDCFRLATDPRDADV